MSMDKKKAARQAAAKFSTDPMAAAVEYGKLTNQIDSTFEFEKSLEFEPNKIQFRIVYDLRDEMFELLPKYRRPTNDLFIEDMIFINAEGPQIKAKLYQEPEVLRLLKKANIPADILKKIEEYVKESEIAKLDLGVCKYKLEGLKKTFKKIKRIYNNPDPRPDIRKTEVVQALGFSTGVAKPRIDKKRAYIDYLNFVRKKGMSRHDATEETKILHGFNSFDATLKALHDCRTAHIGKWKKHSPRSDHQLFESWLKGVILSRR